MQLAVHTGWASINISIQEHIEAIRSTREELVDLGFELSHGLLLHDFRMEGTSCCQETFALSKVGFMVSDGSAGQVGDSSARFCNEYVSSADIPVEERLVSIGVNIGIAAGNHCKLDSTRIGFNDLFWLECRDWFCNLARFRPTLC